MFQVVVPASDRPEVWRSYHEASGHSSREKVIALLRRCFFWPRMRKDIGQWTAACSRCAVGKSGPGVKV